jgi:hypothetical protein
MEVENLTSLSSKKQRRDFAPCKENILIASLRIAARQLLDTPKQRQNSLEIRCLKRDLISGSEMAIREDSTPPWWKQRWDLDCDVGEFSSAFSRKLLSVPNVTTG